VRPDLDRSQYLGAGSNIDVTADFGDARRIPAAQRDLMKDQAINANPGFGMYDYSVWVRNQQATADLACQRNFGPRNRCPKPMSENQEFAVVNRDRARPLFPCLVFPDST
jgi:hypothetical protein